MSLGVAIYDASGQVVYANDGASSIGYLLADPRAGHADLAGSLQVVDEDDNAIPGTESPVRTVLHTGMPRRDVTVTLRTRELEQRWLLIDAVPLNAGDQHSPLVLVSFTDVTKQRAAEARFRSLTEYGSDLVAIFSADGHYLYANHAHQRILGYRPDELVGRPLFDFVPREDRSTAAAILQEVARAEGPPRQDDMVPFLHADGTRRILSVIMNNRLHDPRIHGVVANGRDVTERTRIEIAQRVSEQRFRTLFEEAPIAICVTDAQGIFQLVNEAFCILSGYRRDTLLGQQFTMLLPQRDRAAKAQVNAARFQQVPPDNAIRESDLVAADGHVYNVLLATAFVPDDAGQPQRMTFIVNVSENVAAQRAMALARAAAEELAAVRQQQAEQAEAMAKVSNSLAATLNLADLYDVVFEQASRVLGCDHAAILTVEDGWFIVAANWGEPTVPPGTRIFAVSDVGPSWTSLESGRPVLLGDTSTDPSWHAVEPWVGPFCIRSIISVPLLADGELVSIFEVSSYRANFYTEQHVHVATMLADRVGQAMRNASLYAAEQERARAAEELGRLRDDLLNAVSHEFKTPLTVIKGFTELLQSRWDQAQEPQRLDYINGIGGAASRLQRLVDDLLFVSNPEDIPIPLAAQPAPVADILRGAAANVNGYYLDQRIDLQGDTEVCAYADRDRTQQIVTNLLDNAAKYSVPGSPITVSWRRSNHTVSIRVRDRGPGMPVEGRDQLFTRFGRLPGSLMRSGRVGTGLGLYVGRRLATAMGGDLVMESTGPEGTVFTLELPSA
jgi:PAS domain S-box-containing protein